MPEKVTVQGTVAEGFEGLREEFAAVLAEERPGHADAQLAVFAGGRQVVDLWGGDEVTGTTLLNVFSSTKGAAYLVVALLAQDGVLDLDREVAYYWPEFGAEGKADLTLRELLAHRAGVVGADTGFTDEELTDDRVIAERLAGQRPYWRAGTAFGYHGLVIGARPARSCTGPPGRPSRRSSRSGSARRTTWTSTWGFPRSWSRGSWTSCPWTRHPHSRRSSTPARSPGTAWAASRSTSTGRGRRTWWSGPTRGSRAPGATPPPLVWPMRPPWRRCTRRPSVRWTGVLRC